MCDHQKCASGRERGPYEVLHFPATSQIQVILRNLFPTSEECDGYRVTVDEDHNAVYIAARNVEALFRGGLRVHYELKKHNLHQSVSLLSY